MLETRVKVRPACLETNLLREIKNWPGIFGLKRSLCFSLIITMLAAAAAAHKGHHQALVGRLDRAEPSRDMRPDRVDLIHLNGGGEAERFVAIWPN